MQLVAQSVVRSHCQSGGARTLRQSPFLLEVDLCALQVPLQRRLREHRSEGPRFPVRCALRCVLVFAGGKQKKSVLVHAKVQGGFKHCHDESAGPTKEEGREQVLPKPEKLAGRLREYVESHLEFFSVHTLSNIVPLFGLSFPKAIHTTENDPPSPMRCTYL